MLPYVYEVTWQRKQSAQRVPAFEFHLSIKVNIYLEFDFADLPLNHITYNNEMMVSNSRRNAMNFELVNCYPVSRNKKMR